MKILIFTGIICVCNTQRIVFVESIMIALFHVSQVSPSVVERVAVAVMANLSGWRVGDNTMDPLCSDGSSKDEIDSCVKASLRFYIADLQVIEDFLVFRINDTAEVIAECDQFIFDRFIPCLPACLDSPI